MRKIEILRKVQNFFFKEDAKNETVDLKDVELAEWLGMDTNNKSKLSEVTYFTCLKMLSESLGKLTLKLYQDTDDGIIGAKAKGIKSNIKLRPNPYMTSSVFWSTVEMNRNHYGNSYVWIRYLGSTLQDLWIMPSTDVEILIDDTGYFGAKGKIWYVYTDTNTGKQYTINSDNVMHFKTSTTFDGINGLAIKDILKQSVEGNLASQNFMNNLYENGLTAAAVLQCSSDLDRDKIKRLVKGLEDFGSGTQNAGKIIPIPLGMQLQPLNIKLTDSQFFELKKYSALQIAGAFGIKPNQINDFSKSSYSNSEMQNLSFYVDTLLYILKQYEEEISYKLLSTKQLEEGYFYKFNVNSILRADLKTQMESISKAINNGIYTINEARSYLDLPAVIDGDVNMVNGNYIKLNQIGANYGLKGGEKDEQVENTE